MRTTENKLRDALSELGDQVAAGTVRSLRLPAAGPATDGPGAALAMDARRQADATDIRPAPAGGRAARPWRHWRWLAPAGAAASVLAIAVTMAVISAPGAGRHEGPHRAAALPGGVPRYYVALALAKGRCCGPGVHQNAVVTATATGAILATVTPPRPYTGFGYVSGAADDRTFVLAAQRPYSYHRGYLVFPPTKFFKLTIDPAASKGKRATLTPLPVPVEPSGVHLNAVAVSPDGSMLAVSSTDASAHAAGHPIRSRLTALDLSGGSAGRTWYQRGYAWTSLAWEGDGRTLALFAAPRVASRWTVALLDVAAPGSVPRIVTRLTTPARIVWRDETITPDGRTVLAVLEVPHAGVRYPWAGYDHLDRFGLRTGRLAGTVEVRKVRLGESDQVLWSDSSGQALVISYFPRHRQTGPGIHTERAAAILTGGRFIRIPWSRYAMTAAW